MVTLSTRSQAGKVITRFLFAVVAAGIAFSATVVSAQQTDKDKEAIRRRKIKSVTASVYKYQSGVASPNGSKQFMRRYDQRGNMTDFIAYGSSQGDVLKTETYRYDTKNRLASATFADALHWNDGSQIFSYNTVGQLITSEVRKPDQTVTGKYTYAYDTSGKLVKSVWYKGTGEVLSDRSYRYDTAGNLIEYSSVTGNGQLQEKTSHQYNGAGKAVSSTSYDSSGNVTSRTTYKYDAQQNVIETMVYLPNGSLASGITYRYDSNYDLREETELDSKGQPFQLTKFVYEFY